MSAYSINGKYEFEQPNLISYNYFKLVTGSTHYVNLPLKLYNGTMTQDSTDSEYKVWVDAYDDTTSKTPCIGLGIYTKPAFSSDNTDLKKMGMGDYRRDMAVMHKGPNNLIFVSGCEVSATHFGMPIAPHPSGFVDWRVGLARLGYCLEPGAPTGAANVLVFVDVFGQDGITLMYKEEVIAIESGTGAITKTVERVEFVDFVSGTAALGPQPFGYNLVTEGTSFTGGAYIDRVNKKLYTHADAGASTGIIGYWYRGE